MELIAAEPQVIVSSLTRLEALVQIQGRVTARELPPSAAEHLRRRIDRVLRADPFEVVPCPPDVIDMGVPSPRATGSPIVGGEQADGGSFGGLEVSSELGA